MLGSNRHQSFILLKFIERHVDVYALISTPTVVHGLHFMQRALISQSARPVAFRAIDVSRLLISAARRAFHGFL